MQTLVFIVFVILLGIFIKRGNAENVCLDCSSIIDQNCVINKTGLGYLARAPRDKLLIGKLEAGEKPDRDLEKCINPGYKLLGKIRTFICFWSPKLHCQVVSEKTYTTRLPRINLRRVCSTCAKYCGCEISNGITLNKLNVRTLIIYIGLHIYGYIVK